MAKQVFLFCFVLMFFFEGKKDAHSNNRGEACIRNSKVFTVYVSFEICYDIWNAIYVFCVAFNLTGNSIIDFAAKLSWRSIKKLKSEIWFILQQGVKLKYKLKKENTTIALYNVVSASFFPPQSLAPVSPAYS